MYAQVKIICVLLKCRVTPRIKHCAEPLLSQHQHFPGFLRLYIFSWKKIQAAFGLIPLLLDSRFHLIASCYDERHSCIPMCTLPAHVLVAFLAVVAKFFTRGNLRKGGLVLAHSSKGYSSSWCGKPGGRSMWWLVTLPL